MALPRRSRAGTESIRVRHRKAETPKRHKMLLVRPRSSAAGEEPEYRLALEDFSIGQFQVVQTELDHAEIRYICELDQRPIDLAALTQRVRSALRQPVDVSLRVVNKIERSRSGKFEVFITLVPEAS